MGEKTGPNPTDRAKTGTKRSLLTDGEGVPLSVVVAGANVNDFKLTEETLEKMVVERPAPPASPCAGEAPKTESEGGVEQGLCLDADYFRKQIYELLEEWGYTAHIRPVGSGQSSAMTEEEKREAAVKARRWVVERTHSWLNRFRGLLIRWCKKPRNYLAMLHFACALIAYRAADLLG